MANKTPTIQQSTLPESTAIFAALRDVLAHLYSDPQDARVVVDDAGLSAIEIPFSSRAQTNWHNILTAALHQGLLDALLVVAHKDYLNNESLHLAHTAYRRLLEQGRRLNIPPHPSYWQQSITIYQGAQYARPNYRNDISALLDLYSEPFVGRVAELTEVTAFAASQQEGYLLLEAPAGYGKSALIANMILRYEKGHWPQPQADILYFFVRQEGHRNTATAFYQAVNAQLLSLLGLGGGVPSEQSELRKQFSELWAVAVGQANEEHPLLFLLDGLDESTNGRESVFAELPTGLGDYVHVVVTSRPNPDPLAQISPEHPFQRARTLCLHTFGEAEIGALLAQKQLAPTLAQKVLHVTQGEPLFVRFLVQDIAAKGMDVIGKLLEEPPGNVESYFRYQLHQLEQMAEGDLTWNILGLLTITRGGITLGEIADLWELGPRRIRKAIEPIQRYLIGRERVELMHLQLRKVLLGEFRDNERREYQQAILQWAQRYQVRKWPVETPTYLLYHYVAHLADAGDRGGLAALFANQQWLHVRVTAANYEYDGYIADLMLTWEYVHTLVHNQLTDDGQFSSTFTDCVRYAFIRTSINSLVTNYEPALIVRALDLELWPPSRALSVVNTIADVKKRSTSITTILKTKSLQDPSNQKIRQRAEKAALTAALAIRYEKDRAFVLGALAPQLSGEARDRALQAALTAALNIRYEKDRAFVLGALAPQLSGQLRQAALTAALAIRDEEDRAYTLGALAPQLSGEARDRTLQAALTAALAIEDEEDRAYALGALAPQLSGEARDRTLQAALTAALNIRYEEYRASVLGALAPQLSGQLLQAALTAALAIEDEEDRAYALGALAPQLSGEARDRTLQAALTAALAIEDEEDRAHALGALAPQLSGEARDRTLQAALTAALAIEDEKSLAYALGALAPQLSGQLLQAALTAALTIEDEKDQVSVLGALAPQLSGEARDRTLQAALTAALAIEDEKSRAFVLGALAPQLSGQLLQAALTAALAIRDEEDRAYALGALAPQLSGEARDRALQAALTAVLATRLDWYCAYALGALAPQLSGEARDRTLQAALTAALAIRDERSRAYALGALAPKLSGQLLQAALTAALAIRDEEDRAQALGALAPQLSGQLLQAAPTAALAIRDEEDRVSVLSALAIRNEKDRASVLAAVAPQLSGQLLQAALTAALTIRHKEYRVSVLSVLVAQLSGQLLQAALTAALTIEDEKDRVSVLGALAPQLSGEARDRALQAALSIDKKARAYMQNELKPQFDGQLLQAALTAALAIEDEKDRVSVLGALAPQLSGEARDRTLQAALTAALAIRYEKSRAFVLGALAPQLSGEARDRTLQAALTAALAIRYEKSRAFVLGALAPQLSGEARDRTLQAALTAVLAIEDEKSRTYALGALVPQLSGQLLQAALTAALAIKSHRSRAQALGALAPQLSGEARDRTLQAALTAALAIEDEESRASALGALAAQLGGEARDRALQAALTAALAIKSDQSRSQAPGQFVFVSPNKEALKQIRLAIADTFLFRLKDQPRGDVLMFCANRTLFSPFILPREVLDGIANTIIEICNEWEWL